MTEHLEIFAGLKGLKGEAMAAEVLLKMKEVGLTEKRLVDAGNLSGGQRRKLSLAIALLGDSKVVFLDEPTSGPSIKISNGSRDGLQHGVTGDVGC